MASESLKIRSLEGHGYSSLMLEGTVLICGKKHWFSESKLMIPIEYIQISEHPQFYKDLLIISIIIPLITLIILIIMPFTGGPKITDAGELYFALLGAVAFFEFLMLFALVFNFLFTKKTVRLTYYETNQDTYSENEVGTYFKIEFWKKRKNTKQIDIFLEKLKQKQLQIENNEENKPGRVFEIRNINPKGILFGRCILFCLPAIIFLKYTLLLLALIPIALYLKSSFQIMKQPKEFREALRYFRLKMWDDAIELLLHLHKQFPDYAPAMFLLLDTYIHAERFDDALTFSNEIPENYLRDSNALNLNLWQWKRMNMRRNETD